MKVCGIIAEYNPLHNGHIHHIEQARKLSGCDVLTAVMSGNFVQRGEPAVIDKWKRAEAAVRNGVDLVIELPYIYAVQSASRFAAGGVSLLNRAGVNQICFGSECGNLENLMDIAEAPVNPDHLRETMSSGMSFPKAYSLLTSAMEPNDILAVCYLKAMAGTGIEPLLVQRAGGYLDEEMGVNASAMAIRKALLGHEDVHEATPMADTLEEGPLAFWPAYYPYLRTLLLTTDRKRLNEMFLFSEGIEVHLKKCALEEDTWKGFLRAAVTHRYTAGRIRRTCLQAMCQVTKEEVKALGEADLRVLAFNDTGRMYLKELKKKEIPFASKFTQISERQREMEYRSTLIYASAFEESERKRLLQEEITGARYIR
ncbi:MAG: nucleotidyltransferase family protein [Solobacterium sp.]|nr:nucleotidyltransferase family protein [Solobacterium sp.]